MILGPIIIVLRPTLSTRNSIPPTQTEVQVILKLVHLMGAACILDNGDAFDEITLVMVMQHKESYLPLAEHLLNFVPWEVLCT